MFIGGAMDIIEVVRNSQIGAHLLAVGLLKMVFAGPVGAVVCLCLVKMGEPFFGSANGRY